jgi:GTPase SAR1 family protein
MPVSLIKNYLKGGELTREGLRNNCGLIDEVIERIEGFERVSMSDDVDVSSLPPLEKDRTDFYLIGMPGAGKSCMIASLLAYWEHKGYYNPDVNNPRSIEYTDLLMRPFEKGYLPDRTESNFIDYINLSLNVRIQSRNLLGRINNHTRSIPVNILDMAGEAWRLAAEKGSGLPDHRAYLDNKNEKSIIIVMDNSASISVQSQNIVRIFRYFKDWGVLRNTTSIAVAVTKADLLGSDYSKLGPKVEELIDKKCANLKARLEEFENEFNLSVEYIPYSIGECRWGPFLMDPEFDSNVLLRSSAEKMTSYILESTAGFKSGGLGSIFSN